MLDGHHRADHLNRGQRRPHERPHPLRDHLSPGAFELVWWRGVAGRCVDMFDGWRLVWLASGWEAVSCGWVGVWVGPTRPSWLHCVKVGSDGWWWERRCGAPAAACGSGVAMPLLRPPRVVRAV